MTPELLYETLGSTLLNNAKTLYATSPLLWLDTRGAEIRALVRDARSVYMARVRPSEQGQNAWEASCSCGSIHTCRHVGVLLLALSEPSRRAALREWHRQRPASHDAPDRLLWVGGTQGERYRAVAVIGGAAVRRSGRWRWRVTPALRYVRSDGGEGHFRSFKPEMLTEPFAEESASFVSALLEHGEDGAPLAVLLPSVLEEHDVPVFGEIGAYRAPLAFLPIERVRIGYRLVRVERDEPRFALDFKLESGNVEYAVAHEAMRQGEAFEGSYVLPDGERHAVFYRLGDTGFAHLVRALARSGEAFSPASLRELRAQIAGLAGVPVTMEDPPNRLEAVECAPELVLRLDSGPQGAFCQIRAAYMDEERSLSRRESWVVVHRGVQRDGQGHGLMVRRETDAERELLDRLCSLCVPYAARIEEAAESDGHLLLDEDIPAFLERYGEALLEAGFSVRIRSRPLRRSGGSVSLGVISSGEDWFELQAGVTRQADEAGGTPPGAGDAADADAGVARAAGAGGSADADGEELPDGGRREWLTEISAGSSLARSERGYVLLTASELERLRSWRRLGMGDDGSMTVGSAQLGVLDELYEEVATTEQGAARAARQMMERLRSAGRQAAEVGGASRGVGEGVDPGVEPGRSFRGSLRSYQREGLGWLLQLHEHGFGGCLADDMGLGKTVQALALLSTLHDRGELGPVLVVAPVSTMGNWLREAEAFAPELSVLRYAGRARKDGTEALEEADVVLVSYQILRNDVVRLRGRGFRHLILDEAQAVKNPGTSTYKAVKAVSVDHRIALTGTPVENNTIELWALMDVLNPGLLGTRRHFSREFALPIERDRDEEAAEQLRTLTAPFILRRRKEDVASELPEREEVVLWCEMGSAQQRLYEGLRDEYRARLQGTLEERGVGGSAIPALEGLLRLRQAAVLPGLIDPQYEMVPSAKLDLLLDQLHEAVSEGHKVIVFSQFVRVLGELAAHLDTGGVSYAYLDGQSRHREREIERFQQDGEVPVFLISLKAGGVGINLTAADYVFLIDPWWNPAVEAQAVDRAHRIGRVGRVIAYRFLVEGTVEERVLHLQSRKRALVENLISTEGGSFRSLEPEDILELFS